MSSSGRSHSAYRTGWSSRDGDAEAGHPYYCGRSSGGYRARTTPGARHRPYAVSVIIDRARAQARRHPVLVDAAGLVALLVGDYLLGPSLFGNPHMSAPEFLLTAMALAAVPLRHRWPLPALASTTAGAAAVLLLQGIETIAALAPVLVLYTVALRTDRRTTVLAWASTAAVLASASALGVPGDEALRDALQVLPWSGVVAAVGDALRNRRAYLAAVEERALRAERSREEEARRRVAEERVRIARELHDVVAHHIAVVGVQAGVAQHLLSTEPEAATEALGHVRRAAAAVLEELGDILSVLREPGEPSERGAPAPGLDRLEALLESFAAAGLEIEWSLQGQPRPAAPTVDLVAYRVLEEALTNALKHGTGSAHLSLEYGAESMTLRVVNSTPALVTVGRRPAGEATDNHLPGGGHGLVGMRERTTAVGGTLRIGPRAGDTFSVEAELPLRETGAS